MPKSAIQIQKKQRDRRTVGKHFPNEGKKVLNLVNSLYFEEMVIPMISALKQRFGDEDYKERFRAFYSDLLKFFPIAVFAGNNSNIRVAQERYHFKARHEKHTIRPDPWNRGLKHRKRSNKPSEN